jgi:hypothetical protein
MRWALLTCLSIFVVVFLMVGGMRLAQGLPLPEHWSTRPAESFALLLALSCGMGIVIYGVGWIWGAALSEQSLTATTFWGRRVEVPLLSVTEIRSLSIQGLPCLLVKSNATKSDLHILTLGLDAPEVYSRLYAAAGPSHPLTMWFAPHDA